MMRAQTHEQQRGNVVKAFKRESQVRVLMVSPARSGKSTVSCGLASVISHELQQPFMIGGSQTCDQFTRGPQEFNMFEQFAFMTPLDGIGKEFVLVDDRGYVDETALRAVLSGRLHCGEELRPSDQKFAEILNRPYDLGRMPNAVILPVRANALMDPTSDANARYLKSVQEIISVCAHFSPQSTLPIACQMPVVPVITALDEILGLDVLGPRCLDPAFWAPGAAPDDDKVAEGRLKMAQLTANGHAAGINMMAAVMLGWMREAPVGGYGDLADPRVAALWEILTRSTNFATTMLSQARSAGW